MEHKDHEYDDGKFGQKSGRVIRTERGEQGSVRYYIKGFKADHCVAQTSSADGFWHYQCRNKWKAKYDHRGSHFCGTHFPPKRFARAVARKAKWDREWAADRANHKHNNDKQAWHDRCMEALREIAKGQLNDPAGYAAMILEDKPEKPS